MLVLFLFGDNKIKEARKKQKVVVRSQQYKNGKEAREETERKSGKVHRGRWNMKRNIREG